MSPQTCRSGKPTASELTTGGGPFENVLSETTPFAPVSSANWIATAVSIMMPIQYCVLASRPVGLVKALATGVPAVQPVSMTPVLSNECGDPLRSSYTTAAKRAVVLVLAGMNVTSSKICAPPGVTGIRYIVLAPGVPLLAEVDVAKPSVAVLPPPATSNPGAQPGAGTPRSQAGRPASIRARVLYVGATDGQAK